MHYQRLPVSAWTAFFWLAAIWLANLTASADILWLVGEDNPKFGRVVHRQDNGELLFKVRGEQATYSEQAFAAEKIETLIVNVEVPRLEQLDPAKLKQYRDYAEELAPQKLDPEARDLAIRLLLITAAGANRQNDAGLVESALAGLPDLARNASEREAFERLRMLYARNPWTQATQGEIRDQASAATTDENARQQLLQAIRLIRQENNESALKILSSNEVIAEMKNWSAIVSLGDVRAMTGSSRLSLPQLRRLLTLELALQNYASQPQRANQPPNWSEQAQEPMRGWLQLPSFDTVTEFDPDQSVFRDGQWVKPAVFSVDD